MTITLTAPADDIVIGDPEPTVYIAPAPTGVVPGVWTGGVYTRTGALMESLDPGQRCANFGRIGRRLNEWESTGVAVAKDAADPLAAIMPWVRELHIYRNGQLMFAGPFVGRNATGSDGARTYQASGIMRYLDRRVRVVSEVAANNFFRNPQFDDGISGWTGRTPPGVPIPPTVTFDVDSEYGTQSAVLESGASLYQMVPFLNFRHQFVAEVQARVKIPSAFVGSGILINLSVPGLSSSAASASAAVSSTTPRDVWTTISTTIVVDGITNPNAVIHATFRWDDAEPIKVTRVSLTVIGLADYLDDDSGLEEPQPPTLDRGHLVSNIVQAVNHDLNLGVDAPHVGIVATDDTATPHLAWESIKGQVETGAYDVSVVASRYVRTLTLHVPRQGRDIPPEELVLTPSGAGRNCTDYELDEDYTGSRNDLFAVASDGKFGRGRDVSGWEDGFELQDVVSAPSELENTDQRDAWALTELDKDPGLVVALKLTGLDGALLETVDLGDRVTVQIDDNDVQVDTIYRLIDMDIDPATDTWDANLNLEPT